VLIPRNTTIPTHKSETFSTAADSQTSVDVHVLQGERPLARDNRTLGQFHLAGIPPAPRGVPQIEVSFDIDANGIVNVAAKDKATGKGQKIQITGSSGQSKADVEKLVHEAEAHAAEDKEKRELIDARNQADTLAFSVEKSLNENRTKVAVGDISRIEAAINEVREAVKTDDRTRITKAADELQKASHAMAEALYKAQEGQGGEGGQGGHEGKAAQDGEVVDAEFAETK